MSSNCENEETDLYADLPNFQFDEAFKKLENDKTYLQNKVEVLAAKLEEVKKENEKLAAKVKALGKNISCLYKTAQREIERKEKIIADLRRERDDLLFRRGMHDGKPSYTKRPSRKQLTPTKKVRNGGLRRILEGKGKSDIVNDGTITPSSKEYEEISSLVAVDSQENTVVKKEESIPKVIDLTKNETNVSCSKDAKSSEKAEKTKLLGFNSDGSSDVEILDVEECRPPCHDRKGGAIESQEPHSVRDTEETVDKGKNSTADTNGEIVDPLVTKELQVASLSQASDQVSEEEKSFSSTGSNKNEVTSPVKDKVSVHMTSEDCGFGRRRIRRVVKPAVSPAAPLPTVPVEKGVKRSLEETTEISSEILKNPQLIAVEVKQADPRVHKRRCMDGALMPQSQSDKQENIKDDCGSNSGKDEMVSQTVSSCRTDSGDLLVLKYDATKEKERTGSELVHVPYISDITREVGKKNKKEECDNLNDKGSDDEKRDRMVRDVVKNYGSSFGVCAFGEKTNHLMKGSEPASLSEPDNESKVSKNKAAVSGGSRTVVKDCSHAKVEENANCEHGSSCMSPHLSPNHSYASDNRSPRHSPCSRMTDDEHNSSRRSWDRERVSGSCSYNDRRPRLSGEGSNCGFRKVRGKNDPEYQGRRDRREYADRGRETARQGFGKGDVPLEKSGDHDRGPYRSRDCSRERGRGRSRERSTDRTRDRSRDGRSQERSRDRGRSWDRGRGRSRERSKDRGRDRSSDRSREKSRDRSWDRGRKRSRDRSWDRGRGRSCDRGRGRSGDRQCRRSRDRSNDRDKRCRDYDGDRERGRDERDRGYDRLRDRERGREYDRRRESDRMRSYNRGRDSFKGRDPDRGQDLDRRDSDRVRETSRGSKDSDKSRDGGRERDCRRISGCHSTSKESSPVRDEGKDSNQSKSDEKPGNSRFDLREKLNESVTSPASGKCGGKEWNGYKDWDKPTNGADEKNVSWGAKRSNTHESNGIRSPDKQDNTDPREIRPFISEWD